MDAKRRPSTDVHGWCCPFGYDNIKNHFSPQHPRKRTVYNRINLADDRNAFFDDAPVVFINSIKEYFLSSSLCATRQISCDMEKYIVDVIVGDMMFDPGDVVEVD